MATSFLDLTTAWQQISTTATAVQITSGTILVQVQTASPANTDTRGHVFFNGDLPGVSWGAATAGEKLFARAREGVATLALTPDLG